MQTAMVRLSLLCLREDTYNRSGKAVFSPVQTTVLGVFSVSWLPFQIDGSSLDIMVVAKIRVPPLAISVCRSRNHKYGESSYGEELLGLLGKE